MAIIDQWCTILIIGTTLHVISVPILVMLYFNEAARECDLENLTSKVHKNMAAPMRIQRRAQIKEKNAI